MMLQFSQSRKRHRKVIITVTSCCRLCSCISMLNSDSLPCQNTLKRYTDGSKSLACPAKQRAVAGLQCNQPELQDLTGPVSRTRVKTNLQLKGQYMPTVCGWFLKLYTAIDLK